MSWHEDLPWLQFRRLYRRMRRRFFTAPRPEGNYFLVDGRFLAEGSDIAAQRNVEAIEETLGSSRSYAPNWEFSYNYRGENLNLARVVHADVEDHPDVEWWQTHVRGWPSEQTPGSVLLRAHWEPEPTEHPHAHLDGVGYNHAYGMDLLAKHLDENGIEFSEVTWKRD